MSTYKHTIAIMIVAEAISYKFIEYTYRRMQWNMSIVTEISSYVIGKLYLKELACLQ